MKTTSPATSRPLRLGKHERRLLSFIGRYPGPHGLTANRQDPVHRALASLSRKGLAVRMTVGASVFAELAQDARARQIAEGVQS